MKADVDLDIGRKTFASGPVAGAGSRWCAAAAPGYLVAVIADDESIAPALETSCRFTGRAQRAELAHPIERDYATCQRLTLPLASLLQKADE